MKIIVMTCGSKPSTKQITKVIKEALGKIGIRTLFAIPKYETVDIISENKKAV